MRVIRRIVLLVLVVLIGQAVGAACAQKRQPVASPASPSFGFTKADGLFLAERDVQWTGTTPHCIVRLVLASAPEALASYSEVPIEWCAGID